MSRAIIRGKTGCGINIVAVTNGPAGGVSRRSMPHMCVNTHNVMLINPDLWGLLHITETAFDEADARLPECPEFTYVITGLILERCQNADSRFVSQLWHWQ